MGGIGGVHPGGMPALGGMLLPGGMYPGGVGRMGMAGGVPSGGSGTGCGAGGRGVLGSDPQPGGLVVGGRFQNDGPGPRIGISGVSGSGG